MGYGHDGVPVPDESEFRFLFRESAREGERYGASGARWPVVIETSGPSDAAGTA